MLQRIIFTVTFGLLAACTNEAPEVREPSPAQQATPAPSKRPQPAGTARPAGQEPTARPTMNETPTDAPSPALETATFGAGCFWCVEAVLEQLPGVKSVESGYMGGHKENPTYRQVCSGTTGHAEVVQVRFDPKVIRYETLLKWFFKLHDPTTLNRQGPDVGTQYRSVIFYHSEAQRAAAARARKLVDEGGVFPDPVVTEITAASKYYPAEPYHQDYYRQNKNQGYCRAVITPKLDKLGLDK